jgi:molybdate transport repressor ModE-like protein
MTAVIPLHALELLVAIEAQGSLTAAARVIGVSQPTASAALARLERFTDLTLVERSFRGSGLTAAGKEVVALAQPLLAEVARFSQAVGRFRGEGPLPLRVAASMTIAEYLVPRWLSARWTQSDRADAIEVLVRNSEDVVDLVQNGGADLGFVEGHAALPELGSCSIGSDALLVIAAAGHPVAQQGRPLSIAEFLAAPLVMREAGSGTRDVLEQALLAGGSTLPDHVPALGSTSSIKNAVRYGGVLSVVSSLTVMDELASGVLVSVPVQGLDLRRDLRAVWARPGGPDRRAQAFVTLAQMLTRNWTSAASRQTDQR